MKSATWTNVQWSKYTYILSYIIYVSELFISIIFFLRKCGCSSLWCCCVYAFWRLTLPLMGTQYSKNFARQLSVFQNFAAQMSLFQNFCPSNVSCQKNQNFCPSNVSLLKKPKILPVECLFVKKITFQSNYIAYSY